MYYIIVNPNSRSGNGLKTWNIIKKDLDKIKVNYKAFLTDPKTGADKIVREICEFDTSPKHFIVLGGDGTLNEVINGFDSFHDITLSYIPTGSSNDFARSLHISKNPLIALEHILSSKNHPFYDFGLLQTDFPSVKGIPPNKELKFMVSCGIGFDAAVCLEALSGKMKNALNILKIGKLTYGIIALKKLFKYKPCNAKIVVDDDNEIYLDKVFFIAAMIQPYEGGGFKLAPNASAKDHKLTICIFYNMSRFRGLLLLPYALFGKHLSHKGAMAFDCEEIEIFMKQEQLVHMDGEYAGKCKRIKISCSPTQIHMVH